MQLVWLSVRVYCHYGHKEAIFERQVELPAVPIPGDSVTVGDPENYSFEVSRRKFYSLSDRKPVVEVACEDVVMGSESRFDAMRQELRELGFHELGADDPSPWRAGATE